jgi:glycosyltransferase involved in cell wall biosynthesis
MLTVLFSTRNRAEILDAVLAYYCRLVEPAGGWKLIVVDNGSTDHTQEVISRYQQRLPLVQRFEVRAGKNIALNQGLLDISGDLIVFSDDDAFPQSDWLVRMRAVADAQPDYDIFAGVVVPRWEIHPELWLLSAIPLGAAFTISDLRQPEGPTSSHNVFGPNMALRANIFARGLRFDPRIGPRGSNYAMGSETEFVRRLMALGYKAWYCHDAVVEHLIPAAHLRIGWLRRRAVSFGRGQYRLATHEQPAQVPAYFGIPRYLLRQIISVQSRIFLAICKLDRQRFFQACWHLHYLWGQLIEARLISEQKARGF